MQPWVTVERARVSDEVELTLTRRGDEWLIRAGAQVLMSSRMHGSEELLAGVARARAASPSAVLVGGLGLGYTLRAVLDDAHPASRVTVSELAPELVEWNRAHVGHLAGHPLSDPRCVVAVGDVFDLLARSPRAFDVVLLDVDNGPRGLTQEKNQRLYGPAGVRACMRALRPGGALAVWSSGPDPAYTRRLERSGLRVEELRAPARPGAREAHVVFVVSARV